MVILFRRLTLLSILGAVIALPGAASADITRHCTGYMGAQLLNGVDKNGKYWAQSGTKALAGVVFKGRGRCKNKLKANDCRRQARDLIVKCGKDLWAGRWSKGLPASCVAVASGDRPYGGVVSWGADNTPSSIRAQLKNDVKRAVEHSACCVLRPTDRQLNFAVYLSVHGDNGCKHKSYVASVYKADCRKLRAAGLCGTPRRVPPK